MCLIVDANMASSVFRPLPDDDFKPILAWLLGAGGCLVYGGKLAEELMKVEAARNLLKELKDTKRAHLVAPEDVRKEEEKIAGRCRSNDAHVIALARASGARTLCTHDKSLTDDFHDPKLVSRPRGKVYKNKSHDHLLKHTSGCPCRKSKMKTRGR